jgi:hypothetical protein
MRKTQCAETTGGRAHAPHGGSDLLPVAVGGLDPKSDRFERTRGGADQVRVRGGAGTVG